MTIVIDRPVDNPTLLALLHMSPTPPPGSGMGSDPRGPGFSAAPPPASDRHVHPVRPAPDPGQYAPRRRRLPAVLTAVVVAVVAAVAALATVAAERSDLRSMASPPALARPAASPSGPADSIDFVTPTGTGRLRVVDHAWNFGRGEPPEFGYYLQVTVELVARSGQVDYDPYNFQAFDADGDLFEVAEAGVSGPLLGVGTLSAGERVRGRIAFDIPRGEVTLLMGDQGSTSVTALRIPI